MKLCAKNTKSFSPYDWEGVTCIEGSITKLGWVKKTSVCSKHIEWLPGTVSILSVRNGNIHGRLYTETLPGSLVHCDLENCGLYGEVDLRSLPHKLTELLLSQNGFNGTIRLTFLPDSLQKIDLRNNLVSKVIVKNSELSKSLQYSRFYHSYYKVKALCIDQRKVDAGVSISEYDSESDKVLFITFSDEYSAEFE